MKALFAHDHRFIQAESKVWSETQFEAALWQRYLAYFDTLTIIPSPAGRDSRGGFPDAGVM